MTWKELRQKQAAERRKYLVSLLKKNSKAKAADIAGVSRSNFYDLLTRAGLSKTGDNK